MPDLYEIVSSSGNYTIEVGSDLIGKTLKKFPQALYIIDENLVDRFPASLTNRLVIEATEENKALENMAPFVAALRELKANRDTHIVAVGGGIIQDITTFLASVYMRGLSWTYLPSTVLSMADSCIGGKSSINVLGYKNLVGNFYPPKDIFIDISFIDTLEDDMIVGGLFEAAKICYARSPEKFKEYEALEPSASVSHANMQAIVGLALSTKKWFIEVDEFDQKERLLLNFGHTFGHAIEASTNFEVHHGIGVGVGMLIACEFAQKRTQFSDRGVQAIERLRRHILSMLVLTDGSCLGAPKIVNIASTIEKFEYDKKHKKNFYRVVVPDENGLLVMTSINRDEASLREIEAAYRRAFEQLNWKCE